MLKHIFAIISGWVVLANALTDPIEFTVHPSSTDAKLGDTVELHCEAKGGSFKQWLLDNSVVQENANYAITEDGESSTLTINSLSSMLSGAYRCSFSSEYGTALSYKAYVRYFDGTFSEHPKNFTSYVTSSTNAVFPRESLPFQCTFDVPEGGGIKPIISWQLMNDSTIVDIEKADETVSGSAGVPIYVFFQSVNTGYLLIHDSNNSIYMKDDLQWRCKAEISLDGDNQTYTSNWASVTFHSSAPPPDTPAFSVVPQESVTLSPNETGVIACAVQIPVSSISVTILDSSGNFLIVNNFIIFPVPELTFIRKSNIKVSYEAISSLAEPGSQNLTYTCRFPTPTETIEHSTVFIKAVDPPVPQLSTDEIAFVEDSSDLIQFTYNASWTDMKVFHNGVQFITTNLIHDESSSQVTLSFSGIKESDEGIYQFEFYDGINLVETYFYYIEVLEKAAAKGNNQTYSLDTGTPLDLTCVAEINENDPSVRFLWIKDSIVLRNISITPSSDEVSDMYRISKIGGADEGTITCIPSNDIGNKRTVTFTVAINGPSRGKTLTPDSNVEGKSTQTIELTCVGITATGDPTMSFKWKKQGSLIQELSESVSNGEATSTLIISDLKEGDKGDYICEPHDTTGNYNKATFSVSHSFFEAPEVSVDLSDGMVKIKWDGIDVTGYKDATVSNYKVTLEFTDDKGELNTTIYMFSAQEKHEEEIDIKISVKSMKVWVVGLAGDGREMSERSLTEAQNFTSGQVVTTPRGLYGWEIFLIIFFIVLFLLCCLLLIILLICFLARRDRKEYNAEEREKKYQEEHGDRNVSPTSVSS